MNALLDSISKAFRSLKEDGMILTGFRILHRFRMISVLHSFDFVFKKMEFTEEAPTVNGMSLVFREIREEELERLNFAEGIFPLETIREHFSRGLRFFAAFREGVVIAANGIHPRYAHLAYIKRQVVCLPEGIVYFNCAITSPSYRNLKVGTSLRRFVMNQMRTEGYQFVIAAVFSENKSALRWNSTNGFKRWGRISYIQWMGHHFWVKQLSQTGRQLPHLLDHIRLNEESAHKLPLEVAS